ncbi:MAG: HU family DNA-binding protein [Candidatus Neomarinimicrobiota bacterium]|jgi:nucleoid DNA-binding protein|nr:HU family DNA-binding protein [Candidatus Neomarinimicrobiota bacterium]MDD3965845.1 HU family DNA-binding protein [Candidatus Neomarinimicrobiota bacterium]MDX9779985.1 HU family DNA-binding protein [bacterium]
MASNKITFQELLDEFSAVTGRTKVFSRNFIKDVFATIQEGLRKDENVNIKGLGIFKLQEVAERETQNPRTGILTRIPAHKRIVFRPEKALREMVNSKYEKLKSKPIKKKIAKNSVPEPPPVEKAEEKPAPKETVLLIKEAPAKKSAAPKQQAATPPPVEKKKMPTFIIEEKKKKSAWRWILPLILIILIFVVLYIVPTKYDSLEKFQLRKNSTQLNDIPEEKSNIPGKAAEEAFVKAPKPQPLAIKSPALKSEAPASVTADEEKTFIHIIKSGNTLWGLSKHYYSRATLWPNIYRKNVETVRTPDLLIVGRALIIPELQGDAYELSKADSARIAQGYYLAYRAYKKYDAAAAADYLRVARQFSTVNE